MTRPRLVWRRLPAPIEVLTIGVFYLGYEVLRASSPTHLHAATAHAASLVSFERWAHLDVELTANHWLTAHQTLSLAAGYYYGVLHFVITPLVLGVLWWRRPAQYPQLRSALVLTSVAGLIVFWAWPVAPPRYVLHGTVDTLVAQHLFGASNPHGVTSLIDEYAAMPSLHVGWAVWCAAAVVITARTHWRHLAWLYPVTTTAVVLGTANHYLLDAVAGALLVLAALWITRDSYAAAPTAVGREPAPPLLDRDDLDATRDFTPATAYTSWEPLRIDGVVGGFMDDRVRPRPPSAATAAKTTQPSERRCAK